MGLRIFAIQIDQIQKLSISAFSYRKFRSIVFDSKDFHEGLDGLDEGGKITLDSVFLEYISKAMQRSKRSRPAQEASFLR